MGKVITKSLEKVRLLWQRKRDTLVKSLIRTDLERNQWLSSWQLKTLQWKRLRQLMEHAYKYVPYYQQKFESLDITPRDIRSIKDFEQLPILTKSDIQKNIEWLLAMNFDKAELKKDATGGSTGQPLTFYRDQKGQKYTWLAFERFRNWIGYQSSDKLALIWGADQDIPTSPPPNQRWLNSFACSPNEIETFVEELVKWSPKVLRGYAGSLYLVASYIRKHQLNAPSPKGIESSAEKLWDFQREVIEDVFRCKVFDQYGSREIPSIACECEYHSGLHIFSDMRFVEIVRDGNSVPPGEEGNIIVTDLLNFGMPFIRYEIGDIGVISKRSCTCGRGFPLLKEVKGRVTNTITTPDGRYIHGEYFTHLFYHVKGIEAFQVHQKRIDRIEVRVQPNADFESAVMQPLIDKMQTHLGREIAISWQTVPDIPSAPSGKHHFTISDIPIDFTSFN